MTGSEGKTTRDDGSCFLLVWPGHDNGKECKRSIERPAFLGIQDYPSQVFDGVAGALGILIVPSAILRVFDVFFS